MVTNNLNKLDAVKNRQLDPERSGQLIGDLDRQRQDIHDQAASKIVDSLSTDRSGNVEISHKDAKRLFEFMYVIQESHDSGSFNLSTVDALKPEVLQNLRDELLDNLGAEVQVRPDVHFHADEDEGFVSYTVRILNKDAREKIGEIQERAWDFVENLDRSKDFTAKNRT